MEKFIDGAATAVCVALGTALVVIWLALLVLDIKERDFGWPSVLAVFVIIGCTGGFVRWYWF